MQRRRLFFQLGFFALFLLAPALNLLRFDLHEAQLWFLGQRWSLGIDEFWSPPVRDFVSHSPQGGQGSLGRPGASFAHGEISANQAAIQIFVRAFLPAIVLIAAFLGVAWKYGRLYCGWLCPHFTLVETLNTALHRACGKLSVWDKHRTLRAGVQPSARWWPVFFTLCAVFGFLWAITLLTYLLPPVEIWGGLLAGTLTPNQARFLIAGSVIFTLEFAFARHLFCRFGCAVGLFQSLVWMANPKGMVVAFNRQDARDCRTCTTATYPQGSACDNGCPMRLHPRNIKRMMFSCVQCGQCLDSCEETWTVQALERSAGPPQASSHRSPSGRRHPNAPLLEWKVGADAVRETLRQRKAEREATALLERSD